MNKKTFIALALLSSFAFTACGNTGFGSGILDNFSFSNSTSTYTDIGDTSQTLSKYIRKINCYSDEVGIYTVSAYFSSLIASKGQIEYVYKGAASSPQKNDIVCTFLIDYWFESTGYELVSYFNGDIYLNKHKQEEVSFVLTFGANLRAGDITILYKPDGGTKEQIYYGTADQFYISND